MEIEWSRTVLFFSAFAMPVLLFTVIWRRPRISLPVAILYLATYIVLSVSGRYEVANHGGADWRPKYSVEQYRAFSGRTKTGFTLIGAIYWPCIFVDRLVWHRADSQGAN